MRVELTPTYLRRRYLDDLASASTIAEETGWSSQYVRDRLRQFDIPLRPRGVVKPALDEATLRAELATEDSVRAIAARAGYSRSGVEKLMQRYGLTLPPRPARRLADPELSAALALKYRRGASMEALGAEYGRSADWVRARLVEAGVRPRAIGEQRRLAHLNQIRDLLDEGLRTAEIAERLGCSTTSVLEVMRRHGWKPPAARPRGPSKALPPLPVEGQLRTWYVDRG